MALPTTNLTLHCDASDTGKLFTTYQGSGVHTGTPGDGDGVQVWDDEGDGISDVAMMYTGADSSDPNYRSGTTLMAHPCLDFDGTNDYMSSWTQTGGAGVTAGNFLSVSAYTMFFAFYAESITLTSANVYENHPLVSDATAGLFGIYLRDDGGQKKICVYNYDGSVDAAEINMSVATSYVVMARHEGGNIYISLNGGAETSVASGNTTGMGVQLYIGKGYTAGTRFHGRIGEFALYNAALSGSNLTDALDYFTTKWITGGGGSAVPILMQMYHGG